MKWLIRPKKYDDESPTGYAFRLAEANGFYSYNGWRTAKYGEPEGIRVNEVTAKSKDVSPVMLFGQRYTLASFLRICPHCLREARYIREAWDHALITSCLIHDVELICTCPKCKSILRRGPGRIFNCTCGLPLAFVEAERTKPSAIEHALAFKLGLSKGHAANHEAKQFEHLSSDDFLKLIMLVGTYRTNSRIKPRKVPIKAGIENAKKIVYAAEKVLIDWPLGFHQLLSNTYNPHNDGATMHQVFGSFYSSLYKDLKGEQFDFIRRAFNDWMEKNWKGHITKRHRRLQEGTILARKVIPVSTLCKQVSISADDLKKLVVKGELRGSVRLLPSGRQTTLIELNQEKTIARLTNRHNLEHASALLGLPEKRVRSLIVAGVISGVAPARGKKWQIHVSEIDRILVAIRNLKPFCRPTNAGFWSLNQILRFRLAEGDDFPELIKAILCGDLESFHCRGSYKPGAAAILVDEKSFKDWQKSAINDLSIPAVAERLNIKQEVAYHLVRREIIKTIDRGRLGKFVTATELKAFNDHYLWSRDIARATGAAPRKIISDLKRAGVTAVTGPDIDGCRQYLFMKAEAHQIFSELQLTNAI